MEFKRRNLALLLLSARESVMAQFRPILKGFGLTDQQWRVLREVYGAGDLEVGQIAESCKILSPSLTGILSRMVSQGLVQRVWSETDQRRSIVSLTDTGRALVERVLPEVDARYQVIQSALGDDRLQALYLALDDVLDRLGQAAPSDGEI
jgi:homoprotocatechuate degradation regulator HpaR